MIDAERARLLAQVRVLAAGHLVAIDVGRARANLRFERRVVTAHAFPVHRRFVQAIRIEAGVALAAGQRRRDARQVRLRRESAHCVERAVHRVATRFHRREHRRRGDAARVVRVEMHGQPGFFLQRLHERRDGLRAADAGHVLDAEHVHASLLQFARDADVVLEVVLRARRVEQVAGVADRAFAQHPALAHRVDRHAHVAHPVQRIEYAEHVDARARGLLHEEAHDVVRVVRIADRVRAAQQHLEQDVRHAFAQQREPLPRVFLQEPQRDVEGRAAPAFE